MPKTKPPSPHSKKGQALRRKHVQVDCFAHDNPDREATFQYASKLGLPPDEVAKAVARNFTLQGKYDPGDLLL